MLRCQSCFGVFEKLANAHIIPRSFCLSFKGTAKSLSVYNISPSKVDLKLPQNGEWDDRILCVDCDNTIGQLDTYGWKVLTTEAEESDLIKGPHGHHVAVQLRKADGEKLKLFALSMLWRAAITSLKMFKQCRLPDRFVSQLRDAVRNRDSAKAADFEVIVNVLHGGPNVVLPPIRRRMRGDPVNYIQFYLPDYMFLFKVDRRPIHSSAVHLTLRREKPVFATILPFVGGIEEKYFEAAKAALRKATDRQQSS